MDSKKMRKELETRLKQQGRKFIYNRKKDELRIENEQSGTGINVSLPGTIAKWHECKEKAIEETVYYVSEGLAAMEKNAELKGEEKKIYPVIRSASFPDEAEAGVPFFFDIHTAETRIYYALDMGKTYRLIDQKLLAREGWSETQVRETAMFNARSLAATFKEDSVAGNTFYFQNSNDGYDASRVLNSSLMEGMAEKIHGTMAVAIPHQDVLIVADIRNDTGYDILAQMTMSFFTSGRVPVTALSFLYEKGELEPIFIMAKNKK
ncbi:DUF1444 domain-containing protein [Bacillus massilinigeriensis]|uniref:DUF1444 domain-containing protein n=1 Tax=Bacillus mediterraneensis TaxID=1805474 RepID=UPI0008F95D5F|nr:DUF1444 domain-containing protein [Bacillus mediterraneensis]